jgi:hypothetical protein
MTCETNFFANYEHGELCSGVRANYTNIPLKGVFEGSSQQA